MSQATRAYRFLLVLFACGLGGACQGSTGDDPAGAKPTYAVAPSTLNLTVGHTAALTIAALSPAGDTMAVGAKVHFWARGSGTFSYSGCDRVGQSCALSALGPGVDTLSFDIGYEGRCLDGPGCTAREWQSDTVIQTTVTIQ